MTACRCGANSRRSGVNATAADDGRVVVVVVTVVVAPCPLLEWFALLASAAPAMNRAAPQTTAMMLRRSFCMLISAFRGRVMVSTRRVWAQELAARSGLDTGSTKSRSGTYLGLVRFSGLVGRRTSVALGSEVT